MTAVPSLQDAIKALTAEGATYEMVEENVLGQRLRCFKNVPPTLRAMWESAARFGEREYMVYEDDRLTYAQAQARTAALASWLVREAGVKKGDRVAIAMRNFPEWPIAFWATVSLGAIAVPLNAWWQSDELIYAMQDSGACVLIADDERALKLLPQRAQLGLRAVLAVRAREPIAGALAFEEALALHAGTALPPAAIEPDDDATIFYTSGTTGKPKGALGTHRNLCTNIGSVGYARARAALRRGVAPMPLDGSGTQLALLVSVPFFHVTGCHSMLAYGTHTGHKIVTMHKWQPERALELIERERITHFGGVPSMAWQVIESPDLEKRDTSSVLGVLYGGAPAAPELVRRIKQAFPKAVPSNGYGLTETSAVTTTNSGPDYERKPEAIGLATCVSDVRAVGDDGRDVPPGEIGELWVRGPNVVKGYWNNPEATEKTIVDGWLRTGDVVRIDEEGFIEVMDRAKDMLIRGGENVYCVEVENVLYQHPAVMDAAVLGIPHRVLGEEVGAVVQVTAGATVSEAELQAFAREKLAGFKVPVKIEQRAEPLPRNANGKILKRELKKELGWE
jgi:long-chain acyl-CoA synthetase